MPVQSSLNFNKTRNIVLQNYRNERVCLTGALNIDKEFIKTPDKNIKERLNKKAKEKVKVIDFTPLNIKLSGLIKKGFGPTIELQVEIVHDGWG